MAEKRYPELVEMFYKFNQQSQINLDKDTIFKILKKKGYLDENGNPTVAKQATQNLLKSMQNYTEKEEYK